MITKSFIYVKLESSIQVFNYLGITTLSALHTSLISVSQRPILVSVYTVKDVSQWVDRRRGLIIFIFLNVRRQWLENSKLNNLFENQKYRFVSIGSVSRPKYNYPSRTLSDGDDSDRLLTVFLRFRQNPFECVSKFYNRSVRSVDPLISDGNRWKFPMVLFKSFLFSRDCEWKR